jgi:hypothetical protein
MVKSSWLLGCGGGGGVSAVWLVWGVGGGSGRAGDMGYGCNGGGIRSMENAQLGLDGLGATLEWYYKVDGIV